MFYIFYGFFIDVLNINLQYVHLTQSQPHFFKSKTWKFKIKQQEEKDYEIEILFGANY